MSRAVVRVGQGALALLACAGATALAAGPALAQPTGSVQAQNVTATTATFSGTVTDSSGSIDSEYFQYRELDGNGTPQTVPVAGTPTTPSVQVTGLLPNDQYGVILYAVESGVPYVVSQASFKTSAPPPPTVVTGGASAAPSPGCTPANPSAELTLSGTATLDDANPADTSGYSAEIQLQYWLDNPKSVAPESPGEQQLSNGVNQLTAVVHSAPPGKYEYRLAVNEPSEFTPANSTGQVYGAWQTIIVGSPCGSNGGGPAGVPVALSQSLGISGSAAKIASILRAGGYPATTTVAAAGTLTITWDYVPAGARIAGARRPVVVASGTERFSHAGKATLRLRLTSKGRALLKRSRKVKLTAIGTFKPTAGKAVSKRKNITLTH